jgi:hypothetical protein
MTSSSSATTWKVTDYPYSTRYGDHFETPKVAYQDMKPLIDWLGRNATRKGKKQVRKDEQSDTKARPDTSSSDSEAEISKGVGGDSAAWIVLYDPYYCNGRTATLLHELGYRHVIHERRDFYGDIAGNTVPPHDILITNPPYSDTHKRQCLEFCLQQSATTPFLILMPSYTATKQYYRQLLDRGVGGDSCGIVYVVPSVSYQYDHPENTGKETSPFESMWFCGGVKNVESLKEYWEASKSTTTGSTTLITSLDDLVQAGVISMHSRPNPKQRRARQRGMPKPIHQDRLEEKAGGHVPPSSSPHISPTKISNATNTSKASQPVDSTPHLRGNTKKKRSKYRDDSGGRKRKRF